ncbi:hypothetical protein [Bradyrhizobium sp.]|jgi:hypothetical protein|uniref:hypothetical protein n=1 Tax=Bradyrhizobium sp. TaxID=376 RepID=UPI003C2916E4
MRKTFTVLALLVLMAGPEAIAQTGGRTGSSGGAANDAGSSNKGGVLEAPIGHRQPRASDVPNSTSDDPARLNADDAALDRRIKSICRGC